MSNKEKIVSSCIITFVILFVLIGDRLHDKTITLVTSRDYLYADNTSSLFVEVEYLSKLKNTIFPFQDDFSVSIDGPSDMKVRKTKSGFYIMSSFVSGIANYSVKFRDQILNGEIKLIANEADEDFDGFPDVAELSSHDDRTNFIDWFVCIAESQFYANAHSWYQIHRDCAGLISFAFKEALKIHDSAWLEGYPYLVKHGLPEVEKFNYPEIPILGDRIFRTKEGPFVRTDLEKDIFSETADVNNLLNFNLNHITRNIKEILKGDVIFYLNPDNISYPYHSMIFTGNEDYLVYHTGPDGIGGEGEVRKVRIKDLMRHPDKNWHPGSDNPNFLGVYRWKIVM